MPEETGAQACPPADDLIVTLSGTIRRRLDPEERRELRRRVSDRIRELAPYVPDSHRQSERHEPRAAVAAVADTLSELSRAAFLTLRETHVLAAFTRGATVEAVAYDLNLSVGYVRNISTEIVRKLGARDREHAVQLALGDVSVAA